jgi:glycerate 2-kinase
MSSARRPDTGHPEDIRVVLAPDKFKGSLTAPEVAEALKTGLLQACPNAHVVTAPIADGGEGTVDAALANGFTPHRHAVLGPLGTPVEATFAVRERTAIIELAQASGLHLLPAPGPTDETATRSTTYGTGQLVRAALDAGCTEIVLGLGGSATTDGGSGVLHALGATLTDENGANLAPGTGHPLNVHSVDLTTLDPRLGEVSLVAATDVDNPLCGPRGAAAVFGPQKGAGPGAVPVLDRALRDWAKLASMTPAPGSAPADRATDIDLQGGGAAGGVGFAAALMGARLRPGIEVIMEVAGIHDLIAQATLVVTGEGSLDDQSLGGKAPIGVAQAARRVGVPVVAVAGRSTLSVEDLIEAGFASVYALLDREPNVTTCLTQATRLLRAIGADLGTQLESRSASLGKPEGV